MSSTSPLPPSPHTAPLFGRGIDYGVNALSAPTTPAKREVIVDRSKVDPKIIEAAEGFEAEFISYMMKTMRETVPKNEMDLESTGSGIYRSMLDDENAQKAARAGGVGIADQIIAYLTAQRYNQPTGTPPDVHGGTDEGQSHTK